MEVINENEKFYVRWRYGNSILEGWLEQSGILLEDFKSMTFKEKLEAFGVKQLPLPDSTTCIISDEDHKDLVSSTVKRRAFTMKGRAKCEQHSKTKARMYSLTKALHDLFPGEAGKKMRTLFWETYRNPSVNVVKEEQNNQAFY